MRADVTLAALVLVAVMVIGCVTNAPPPQQPAECSCERAPPRAHSRGKR